MIAFDKPRTLEDGDDLSGFSCGVSLVDEWVVHRAAEARKRGTAVVYIIYSNNMPAGIYSLSAYSVARESLRGGWLKRNSPAQIPVILLGMLGVDSRFKGVGSGWSLLQDAIVRASAVAGTIGAKALLVEPADDAAAGFYRHFGFRDVEDTGMMYLRLPATQR